MKNFFSSPSKTPDLQNFSKLEIIQKQLRDLRDDNIRMSNDIRTIVKGIALLVTVPEPEEIEV